MPFVVGRRGQERMFAGSCRQPSTLSLLQLHAVNLSGVYNLPTRYVVIGSLFPPSRSLSPSTRPSFAPWCMACAKNESEKHSGWKIEILRKIMVVDDFHDVGVSELVSFIWRRSRRTRSRSCKTWVLWEDSGEVLPESSWQEAFLSVKDFLRDTRSL